ncbi:MAG: hypothetical protein E3J21_11245 [Anaerolineales bacterium]|nr:MAG: hypothetical protein E3J21_11245 [Anaerolineales bacterium]
MRTSVLPWVVACPDYSPKAAFAQTTTLRHPSTLLRPGAQGTTPAAPKNRAGTTTRLLAAVPTIGAALSAPDHRR